MPTIILAGHGRRFVQRQAGGLAGKDSRPTAVLAPVRPQWVSAPRRCWPPWVTSGWPRWVSVGRHSHADNHSRGIWPPVRSTACGWIGGKGFPPHGGIGPGGWPWDGLNGFPPHGGMAPVGDLGATSVGFRRSAFPCRQSFSRGMATGSFNGMRVDWREGIPAPRRYWPRWVALGWPRWVSAPRRYWPPWVTSGWPRWVSVGRHSHADTHSRGAWPPVRSTACGTGWREGIPALRRYWPRCGLDGFPPHGGVGPRG